MAKLPALVKAVTAVDGREHKTIEHVARVVREAGFIPTGKRGGGSADVTYEAAANLIIGLNITDVPKRIPYELERMRSLATFICGNTDDHEAFRQLSEAKNFGEALALTIENVPAWWELACGYVESEYFPKSQEQRLSLQRMFTEGNGVFLIVVELQKYSASISFEKPIRSDADATMAAPNTEEVYFQSFMADTSMDEWAKFYKRESSNRRVRYSFSLPTLAALYNVVSGKNPFSQFDPLGD